MDNTALIERLGKVESSAGNRIYPTTNWYRNPDGPDAIKAIQSLEARTTQLEREKAEAVEFATELTRTNPLRPTGQRTIVYGSKARNLARDFLSRIEGAA